ncbi:hypothetical protein ALC62_14575 [Cyphomyrmex costatus]|uniref:Uncharacterized protein n=1 Tax=Cyphomyrmex costatus TaxID=456900 RepID=A0A195C309_9HYME|nr:hypothetical protein ALC62_14575 [Cyphomyrmex costatus]
MDNSGSTLVCRLSYQFLCRPAADICTLSSLQQALVIHATTGFGISCYNNTNLNPSRTLQRPLYPLPYRLTYLLNALAQGGRKCCSAATGWRNAAKFACRVAASRSLQTQFSWVNSGGINAKLSRNCQRQHLKPASPSTRRENYCVFSSHEVVGMAAKLYGVSFICSLPGHKMFRSKTSKGTPFCMKSPVAKILASKMNVSPQAYVLEEDRSEENAGSRLYKLQVRWLPQRNKSKEKPMARVPALHTVTIDDCKMEKEERGGE